MCLTMDSYSNLDTKRLKARKKPIRAYKVLTNHQGKLYSPIQCKEWKRNKIKISNRRYKKPTQLTATEIRLRIVYKGLHFYRTRASAQNYIGISYTNREIWTVEIQPEDVITTGCGHIVAHKAKLIKKVH